jgi:hypothetical protein
MPAIHLIHFHSIFPGSSIGQLLLAVFPANADRIAYGLPDDVLEFAIMTRYQAPRRTTSVRAVPEPPWRKFAIPGLLLLHTQINYLIYALKSIPC